MSSTIAVTGTDPTGGTVCKPFGRLSEFTVRSISSSVLDTEGSDSTVEILEVEITEIL